MNPEWMMAADAETRRITRTKTDPLADPLERDEWARLDWISRFLTWCVAGAPACSQGYTSSLTRSISPGLSETMPAKKTG